MQWLLYLLPSLLSLTVTFVFSYRVALWVVSTVSSSSCKGTTKELDRFIITSALKSGNLWCSSCGSVRITFDSSEKGKDYYYDPQD